MKNATQNCPKRRARKIYQEHVNTLTNNGALETTPSVRAGAKSLALDDANRLFIQTEQDFSTRHPHGQFHITDDYNHLNEVISEIQRY